MPLTDKHRLSYLSDPLLHAVVYETAYVLLRVNQPERWDFNTVLEALIPQFVKYQEALEKKQEARDRLAVGQKFFKERGL